MTRIPCVLMRGGSSKGLFFLARHLPSDEDARNRLLLAALGSPDVRQIDGLGGGNDLSSKIVIVGPSSRPGIDVEYLFAQVSVAHELVDVLPNSGNMLAGVGPFAIEQGLVKPASPMTRVRILNMNSNKVVEAILQTPGGRLAYEGDFHLEGVPGTSAPITLNFIDPTGTRTGRLLPTGQARDLIDDVPVSCMDFAIPIVFVKADSLGRTGHESAETLNRDTELLHRLEAIRQAAAQRMGLTASPDGGVPKIAMVAPPRHGGSVASRYFVPSSCHPVHAATGALALAAACHTADTVVEDVAELDETNPGQIIIEHPSGQMPCQLRIVADPATGVHSIHSASIRTSARSLMSGEVFIREPA